MPGCRIDPVHQLWRLSCGIGRLLLGYFESFMACEMRLDARNAG